MLIESIWEQRLEGTFRWRDQNPKLQCVPPFPLVRWRCAAVRAGRRIVQPTRRTRGPPTAIPCCVPEVDKILIRYVVHNWPRPFRVAAMCPGVVFRLQHTPGDKVEKSEEYYLAKTIVNLFWPEGLVQRRFCTSRRGSHKRIE